MPSWTALLLILAATLLPGWLILSYFVKSSPFTGNLLERLFASLALGVTTLGWIALVLAESGSFSLVLLAVIWLLLSLSLGALGWKKGRGAGERGAGSGEPTLSPPHAAMSSSPIAARLLPAWLEYPFLGFWLLAATWLFFRPHEFITGGADAGVYINLGAEIARNGSILIQDELLAEVDDTLYPAFLRPIPNNPVAPYYILPAFFVVTTPPGEITPQFYPLHPVWQAIAYSLGGVWAELMLTGLWALLGSLAVYLAVRHFAGWEVAALALLGLSINGLQVWFARYPVTEALTQYLIWTGLWSLGAWLSGRQPQPLWALLAGLALGEVFLVRIDTYFLWGIVGLLGLWLYGSGQWRREHGWFFLPLGLLTLHSLVHALWQSRPYFFDLFGYGLQLLRLYWAIPALIVILGVAILLGLGRYRHRLMQLARYQRPALLGGMMAIVLLAGYGWFIRPYLATPVLAWNDWYSTAQIPMVDRENLIRLGWYLSPIGIWLGVAGACLLLWRINGQTAAMAGVGLMFSLLYLWRIQANPHQIYAMRRYVPVVMPFFIVAAAFFLGWLASQGRAWLTGVAAVLATLWLGGLGWSARGFVNQVDARGILAQMDQFNAQLTPHSILIFNDPAPIGQGDLLGTPLRFLYGHDVFTLREPAALDSEQFARLLQKWQADDRTVYWVTVPQGYEWPMPGWPVQETGEYSIHTVVLEGTYDRRPTALLSMMWQGKIAQVGQWNLATESGD